MSASIAARRPPRQTRAEARRQLVFDLERHPLEALPLTQLFLVLAKRKSSWWAALDATHTGTGNSEQHTRQPADASAAIAARNGGGGSGNSGSGSGSGGGGGGGADVEEAACAIEIPDTVVWENNIPKGWFYFDHKDRCVLRRKVETQHIQRAFLAGAEFENDVVAVTYAMPLSGEKDELQYRFLTAAQLPAFLFENRRGKGTCILQRFIFPLTVTHNDMIQAVWTPTVVQVSRRQNVNAIFDERVDVNARCSTFEGPTHHSQVMHSTSRLRAQIKHVCNALALHFRDTEPRFALSRLLLFFKMSDCSRLQLLFCTSARVLSTNVHSSDSFLHRKFRVSLELATRFVLRETEDDLIREVERDIGSVARADGTAPPGSPMAHAGSQKRASLLLSLGTPSKREQTLVMLQRQEAIHREVQHRSGKGRRPATPPASGPRRSLSAAAAATAVLEPTTSTGVRASRLGFVLRPHPLASGGSSQDLLARRGRPTSAATRIRGASPAAAAASGSPSSSAGRFRAPASQTVISIVQDALRAERSEEGGDLRARHGRLLQRCIDKVGVGAARAALLSLRAASQSANGGGISDAERMELLCLRLAESGEKRRQADGVGDDGNGDGGDIGQREQQEQEQEQEQEQLSQRQREGGRMTGAAPLVAGAAEGTAEVQAALVDRAYEVQTHFTAQPHVFMTLRLDPDDPADALLLRELQRIERANKPPRPTSALENAASEESFFIEDDLAQSCGATLQCTTELRPIGGTGAPRLEAVVTIAPHRRAAQLFHHVAFRACRAEDASAAAAALRQLREDRAQQQQQQQPHSGLVESQEEQFSNAATPENDEGVRAALHSRGESAMVDMTAVPDPSPQRPPSAVSSYEDDFED